MSDASKPAKEQRQLIKSVKGTRDLLPPDTDLWNFVEAAVRDVFRVYNFHEIRTPIIEDLALFQRSVGEETDIVSKELYVLPEAGGSKELLLQRAWLLKHANRASLLPEEKFATRYRPDYKLTYPDGKAALVDIKGSLRPESIESLSRYVNTWALIFPMEPPPKAIIVVPKGGVSPSFKQLALDRHVEIEELSVESSESSEAIALRPENTAGVVRAYIEHKLWERPGLQKLFYIGPQFRRERPQKGRYRQFYQIGAEVIGPPSAGSESPLVDAEVIELLATLLDRLGISGWTLELNSVGCEKDRPRYNEALRAALKDVVGKMCSDCQRRAVTNPLRVFDCKVPADQPIIAELPRMLEYLDDDCRKHFEEVQSLLRAMEVPFTIRDTLVRGLDYYQRTAYEFTHGALGAQNAILGGGRYDGLSETLGGPRAPGIGFAIGEDRLIMAVQEGQTQEGIARPVDVFIAPVGAGMNREAARLARELRRHDIIVQLGDESFRLKKSLETASKIGARFALIVGENEVARGTFALKFLASGQQADIPRAELAQRIQSGR